MMSKHSIIRTIYLYLFSLVGLALLIIGAVNFIDMGLKATLFTQVEKQDALNYNQPPYSEPALAKIPSSIKTGEQVKLSVEDYDQVQYVIADYKNWKARQGEINQVVANRQRKASINLALILVGAPLFLYHWLTINREKKSLISQITG